MLQTLVLYRLIDPGSEWRLHRHWFDHSAVADLLGSDFRLAEQHHLYACHDLLLQQKRPLFDHLTQRWRDLGIPTEEVLEEMRRSTPPVSYLVGTPKGRLTMLEQPPLAKIPPSAQGHHPTQATHAMRRPASGPWHREEGSRTRCPLRPPAKLWQFYLQLTDVEQAFRELKGDLAIRPVHHQRDRRIEAHIFVSFLAYALQVTLKARLKKSASGLTPRAVLEKFAAMQMLDVNLPTTDGREVILSRHTHPEKELQLLLDQIKLTLPDQPPPRITTPSRR